MAGNVFRKSRLHLTLYYSAIMGIFLLVLLTLMYKSMHWALFSEQAYELQETANDIVHAQSLIMQHKMQIDPESDFREKRDRLFFYAYSNDGVMLNFSRSSFRLEPFIFECIASKDVPQDDVKVYTTTDTDGRVKKVMLTAKPIVIDGAGAGMTYVGKDVTVLYNGLKKATYALAALGGLALLIAAGIGHAMSGKAIVPLKEAYEKQRQFAADASHELRTPLSVVLASADLLENDPSITSPLLKQVIADIRDEVKNMTRLVNGLLFVVRSDNKAVSMKKQWVDIAKIIQQTGRVMRPLAEKKNIKLINENVRSIRIKSDPQKLKQLLTILVDNAVKYTPEGGSVTLTQGHCRDEEEVVFSVRDTGIGIPPEEQERIFDRFYRVDKARARAQGGNGLGLAIASEIIRLHHGKIAVESEMGKGTVFTVTLPSL